MKSSTVLLIAAIGVLILMGAKTILETIVDQMAEAIKDFEGWYPGSRSYRNNNPGNLRWFDSEETIPWEGASGVDEESHVIFINEISGMNALKHQLTIAFTGLSKVYSPMDTFYSFFNKYAEGNQTEYAEYVAGKLGTNPNSTLASLLA